jgi:hypothetical protein
VKTILIVEDDNDLRTLFRNALAFHGYRVLEAGDGLNALRTLDREAPPDLIIDQCAMGNDVSGGANYANAPAFVFLPAAREEQRSGGSFNPAKIEGRKTIMTKNACILAFALTTTLHLSGHAQATAPAATTDPAARDRIATLSAPLRFRGDEPGDPAARDAAMRNATDQIRGFIDEYIRRSFKQSENSERLQPPMVQSICPVRPGRTPSRSAPSSSVYTVSAVSIAAHSVTRARRGPSAQSTMHAHRREG